MKLYYSPGTCALAPHIVALESGQKVELVKVDLASKKTESGEDYLKTNLKGYVPALVLDSGDIITEASIVCQYLADQNPEAGLISPFGTLQRYQEMSALNFAATEVHKQIGALFNPAMTPEMKKVQLAHIAHRLNSLEQMLAGKSYIMGERFTAPDAYLFTVLRWTRIQKIDVSPWPHIQAYIQRVGEREKVKEALKQEGLH